MLHMTKLVIWHYVVHLSWLRCLVNSVLCAGGVTANSTHPTYPTQRATATLRHNTFTFSKKTIEFVPFFRALISAVESIVTFSRAPHYDKINRRLSPKKIAIYENTERQSSANRVSSLSESAFINVINCLIGNIIHCTLLKPATILIIQTYAKLRRRISDSTETRNLAAKPTKIPFSTNIGIIETQNPDSKFEKCCNFLSSCICTNLATKSCTFLQLSSKYSSQNSCSKSKQSGKCNFRTYDSSPSLPTPIDLKFDKLEHYIGKLPLTGIDSQDPRGVIYVGCQNWRASRPTV